MPQPTPNKKDLPMKLKCLAALPFALAASISNAQNISVEITNLTHGIFFTPILISAHTDGMHLFEVGTSASTELQTMAEGGDISGLVATADAIAAVSAANPAGGLLAPSTSTMAELDTGDNMHLSITAMVLPSNDGFVGLDAWAIPETAGTYTLFLNAYDAGTEANNELILEGSGAPGVAGIPANPGGNGGTAGTGVTSTEANNTVHVHRGNLGDADLAGGTSDLDNRIHRWLNPVAKVVVTVQ